MPNVKKLKIHFWCTRCISGVHRVHQTKILCTPISHTRHRCTPVYKLLVYTCVVVYTVYTCVHRVYYSQNIKFLCKNTIFWLYLIVECTQSIMDLNEQLFIVNSTLSTFKQNQKILLLYRNIIYKLLC